MKPPRIAVIDDCALVHRTLQLFLGRRGYELVFYDRAADVLPFVRQHRPALVIAELHLEYRDAGFEVVRALRDDPTTVNIPILFLSTDPELEHRVAGIDSPAVRALSKSADVTALLAAIEQLLAA